MAILQVDNLSKSFGILRLFEGLDFSIEKGQKVGLIAPNGAGKTTLLRILVGLESADSGEVITQRDLKIAYLPQRSDFTAYPDLLTASLSGIAPELREVIVAYEAAVESGDSDQINKAIARMDQLDG